MNQILSMDKHGLLFAGALLMMFGSLYADESDVHSSSTSDSNTNTASLEQSLHFTGDNAGTGKRVRVVGYSNSGELEAGDSFTLQLVFSIEPKWHIYWHHPGETGVATEINLKVPDAFQTGDVQWPTPIRFDSSRFISYGYREHVVLFVPVTVQETPGNSTQTIQADIFYAVCKERCIQDEVSLTLRVPGDKPPESQAYRELLQTYRDAIPSSVKSLSGVDVFYRDGTVFVEGHTDRIPSSDVQFYPASVSGVDPGELSITETADHHRFQFRIPVTLHPENHVGDGMALRGLLVFGDKRFSPAFSVNVPLSRDRQ